MSVNSLRRKVRKMTTPEFVEAWRWDGEIEILLDYEPEQMPTQSIADELKKAQEACANFLAVGQKFFDAHQNVEG